MPMYNADIPGFEVLHFQFSSSAWPESVLYADSRFCIFKIMIEFGYEEMFFAIIYEIRVIWGVNFFTPKSDGIYNIFMEKSENGKFGGFEVLHFHHRYVISAAWYGR